MSNKTKIITLISLVITYILFSPTPKGIDPLDYKPEKHLSLDDMAIDKDKLRNAFFIQTPALGAEDVEIDSQGNIYSGLHDGSILRVTPDYTDVKVIAKSEGPIFGIDLSKKGDKLALADQILGIRILDLKTGTFQNIASQYNGVKFASPNGVVFGKNDETLYFTVASQKIKMSEFHQMLLYSEGSGRIFRVELRNKQLQLLAEGLHFVNGIQYNEKLNCLYFVETSRSRLSKLDLSSKDKGKVILQNILGYPDNVKLSEQGNLWIAIPALRDSISNMIDHLTIVRKVILNMKMPLQGFLALANMKYAGGIKVNPETGQIVQYFFGKGDKINCISGINQKNGKLYLSSLGQNKIAVVNLSQVSNQKYEKPQAQQL